MSATWLSRSVLDRRATDRPQDTNATRGRGLVCVSGIGAKRLLDNSNVRIRSQPCSVNGCARHDYRGHPDAFESSRSEPEDRVGGVAGYSGS
jgi:hypothetical protein